MCLLAWPPISLPAFLPNCAVLDIVGTGGDGIGSVNISISACLPADSLTRLSACLPAVLDIVGTGGDGIGSVNISTGATVISAAAGAKVAKHGNRSGAHCPPLHWQCLCQRQWSCLPTLPLPSPHPLVPHYFCPPPARSVQPVRQRTPAQGT